MALVGDARKKYATAVGAFALAGLVSLATAEAAAPAFFDKPAKTVKQPLPKDKDNPQAKPALTCTYYPHFMVKQIDLGGPGADQLSILPIADGGAQPACKKDNAPGEIVLQDWSGWLKGVRGDLIFWDADDGWNGGLGFDVTTTAGKKIMEDVAKHGFRAVDLATDGTLTLRYTRVYGATCSLYADAAACWQKVKGATGLADPAPVCKAAYEKEIKRVPDHADDAKNDPTAIDYDVVTTISGGTAKITAAGKALECRPQD